MNDNRNYKYKLDSKDVRNEFKIIAGLIKPKSKVIDLGSGDGTLLKILRDVKKTDGVGIEISHSGVKSAKNKNIRSIQGRIDESLPFKDKAFDYAVCNVTLQMVMYPEVLLSEMKRISKKQIITFPNFAFLLNRLDILFNGIMPRVMIPGYKWYSTGHIHQLSIKDFKVYCKAHGISVLEVKHIGPSRFLFLPSKYLIKFFPNMFATTGVFLIK